MKYLSLSPDHVDVGRAEESSPSSYMADWLITKAKESNPANNLTSSVLRNNLIISTPEYEAQHCCLQAISGRHTIPFDEPQ